MDTAGNSKVSAQQFAFVLVNQNNQIENETSLKDVRSHAMREALRQKKLAKPNTENAQPLPYRTGRFRLAASRSKPKKKIAATSTLSGPPAKERGSDSEDERIKDSSGALSLSQSPLKSDGLLDPFDTMPIKLGSRQQLLLYYYDRYFTSNAIAFNQERRSRKLTSTDQAWCNATFSLVAKCYDLHRGINGTFSADCLDYRGTSLRMVSEAISSSPTTPSDGVMGAVATLCNFDIFNGNYTSAKVHMAGLLEMVKLRGGLQHLGPFRSFLPTLVSWSNLYFVSVFGGMPFFPLMGPPFDVTNNIKMEEEDGSRLSSDNRYKTSQHHFLLIDERLRVISRTMDQETLSREDRIFLASGIGTTQHNIASMLGAIELGKVDESSSGTHIAYYLAALLYMNLALREMLPNAEMHTVIMDRLRRVMTEDGEHLLLTWDSSAERLLWVAFMGAAAAHGRTARPFFLNVLQRLRKLLQIEHLEQFQDILRTFGWRKGFSEPHAALIWTEMENPAAAGCSNELILLRAMRTPSVSPKG